jgi:hypothetical protein
MAALSFLACLGSLAGLLFPRVETLLRPHWGAALGLLGGLVLSIRLFIQWLKLTARQAWAIGGLWSILTALALGPQRFAWKGPWLPALLIMLLFAPRLSIKKAGTRLGAGRSRIERNQR